jgi:SAM-dependent methyltransferase
MSFASLEFAAGSSDAVFAMNCLLHVPLADLPGVLDGVSRVLIPDGLFFWGQHGGFTHAGPWPEDHYEPKRFFSLLTDEDLRLIAAQHFAEVGFETVDPGDGHHGHFQALTLRRD